jgi:hypothetical protein
MVAGQPFDPELVLAVLERHNVEFVVGGYAARLHGAARPTSDVTPRTTRDNLDRLASALREQDVDGELGIERD